MTELDTTAGASTTPQPAPSSPAPAQTRADRVFETLRRRILAGELAPGDRLPPERELAPALDTNRNTLREAIRKLEESRLVTVRHGSGVTVSDFRQVGTLALIEPFLEHAADPQERIQVLLDALEARAQVLEVAVRMVARRATSEDVARLDQLAAQQIRHWEADDKRSVALGDLAFHDAVIDAAHSLTIRWIANSFLEITGSVIERFPSLWVTEPTYPQFLRLLVGCISAGDGEGAVSATRDYYQRADEVLVGMLGRLQVLASKE